MKQILILLILLIPLDISIKQDTEPASKVYRKGKFSYHYNASINKRYIKQLIMLINQDVRDPSDAVYIKISLNSGGGTVQEGFKLIDLFEKLRRRGYKIHVHCKERCASMAFTILRAADLRTMDTTTQLMTHHLYTKWTLGGYSFKEAEHSPSSLILQRRRTLIEIKGTIWEGRPKEWEAFNDLGDVWIDKPKAEKYHIID